VGEGPPRPGNWKIFNFSSRNINNGNTTCINRPFMLYNLDKLQLPLQTSVLARCIWVFSSWNFRKQVFHTRDIIKNQSMVKFTCITELETSSRQHWCCSGTRNLLLCWRDPSSGWFATCIHRARQPLSLGGDRGPGKYLCLKALGRAQSSLGNWR
jgi:hypothetical protein